MEIALWSGSMVTRVPQFPFPPYDHSTRYGQTPDLPATPLLATVAPFPVWRFTALRCAIPKSDNCQVGTPCSLSKIRFASRLSHEEKSHDLVQEWPVLLFAIGFPDRFSALRCSLSFVMSTRKRKAFVPLNASGNAGSARARACSLRVTRVKLDSLVES